MSNRLFGGLEEFADAVALIKADGSSLSFSQLARFGDAAARPIGEPRCLVLLEAANTVEAVAFYVGALRAGHVVVLTGPGGGDGPIAARYEPKYVYGRRAGIWTLERRGKASAAMHPDLAVLLSTSGSTGSPKLVRLSHANLLSNARAIATYLELASGERAITSLPIHYSYGLSVLHSHTLFGHAVVLSEHSVTDDAFWRQVDGESVTSLAGVPYVYELLEGIGFLERDHPTLRYLTQAGGRLSADRVRLFAHWAEKRGKRFYVMYGQTEASPRMAYLPPRDAAAYPDAIGVAIPGGTFRLEPLEGATGLHKGAGELVYSGPNVMMGYAIYSADLAGPPGAAELRTGDIAVYNEVGYLRVLGRTSRFAKIVGLRISFDVIEERLKATGTEAMVTGDDTGLVVAIVKSGAQARVSENLTRTLGIPTSSIAVMELDVLPRLPSGKPDYALLLTLRPKDTQAHGAPLAAEIASIMKIEMFDPSKNFVELGGDSLNYVDVSMAVESRIGWLPRGWENIPVSELESLARIPSGRVARVESSLIVRALAIILVLFNHVSELGPGGAAATLLMVSGLNYGRFSVPRILRGELTTTLSTLFWRVVLPYFLVITVLFAYSRQVYWPQYLLYSNLTGGFFVNGDQRLTIFWFMETYITIFLVSSLILSVPLMRDRASAWWPTALVGCLISALAQVGALISGELAVFQPHSPAVLAWLWTLGLLIQAVDSRGRRIFTLAVAAGHILLSLANTLDLGGEAIAARELAKHAVIAAAVVALLFFRDLPVGNPVAKLITVIAGASLYIYICQPFVLQPTSLLFPTGTPTLAWPLVMLFCILSGIGVRYLVNRIQQWST